MRWVDGQARIQCRDEACGETIRHDRIDSENDQHRNLEVGGEERRLAALKSQPCQQGGVRYLPSSVLGLAAVQISRGGYE